MKHIFLFLFCLISFFSYGQSQRDIDLAREYLRNKEFQKAVSLYEVIYAKNQSPVIFKYYIQSLVGTGDYKHAEKIAKKFLRSHRDDFNGVVELGLLYQMQGDEKAASDLFTGAINSIGTDYSKLRQLSNLFLSRRQFNWAEQVYLHARKKDRGDYKFNYELANIYYYQRNYPKMIDEYLNLLSVNDRYLNTVQTRLRSAVYSTTDDSLTDLLKQRLILASQKYKGSDVFNELLIWTYLQDDEFDLALVQAKALDRRNNEDGHRLIAIARQALEGSLFSVVADATNYILQKKVFSPYNFEAKELYLKSKYKQVENGSLYTKDEILELIQKYKEAIKELPKRRETIGLYTNLCRLYAFSKNDPDSAFIYIEKAKRIPGLGFQDKGALELLMADIQLSQGKLFDATLTYAAVERKYKNNPIGYEAKYRKAKMAFYQCDFEWAKGQLDVLKASTSKLIANNAAELSLLIFDNMSEDTLQKALCIYARAKLAEQQKDIDGALNMLDSIINGFIGQPVFDDAVFAKGEILRSRKEWENAAGLFLTVADDFSSEPIAPKAAFFSALIFEEQLDNKQKAFELYKRILTDYPTSIFYHDSRKRLRDIRSDEVN